jgi:hypothetical protein
VNSDFFDIHPELYDNPFYDLASEVDADDCQILIDFLRTQEGPLVTAENVRALQALAEEFAVPGLIDVCSRFEEAQVNENVTGQVLALEDSVSQQSEAIESLERDFPRAFVEFLAKPLARVSGEVRDLRREFDDRLGTLRSTCESSRAELEASIGNLRSEIQQVADDLKLCTDEALQSIRGSIRGVRDVVEICYGNGLKKFEFPMKTDRSFDGIIAHLTKKHGGNVHEKGIVTITSRSIREDNAAFWAPSAVADFDDRGDFWSKQAVGEWICWDFGQMRIRPTNYTITAANLMPWSVEGSFDGLTWTEIDRVPDEHTFQYLSQEFTRVITVSFVVSKPAEFRLIRVIQKVGAPWGGDPRQIDVLVLRSVEFFGTLKAPQ